MYKTIIWILVFKYILSVQCRDNPTISIYEFHSEVAVIILTSKIQGVFLFYIFESYAFQKFGLLSTLHMLGPFTFTFTLELKNFKNLKKLVAPDLYYTMINTRAPDGAKNSDYL